MVLVVQGWIYILVSPLFKRGETDRVAFFFFAGSVRLGSRQGTLEYSRVEALPYYAPVLLVHPRVWPWFVGHTLRRLACQGFLPYLEPGPCVLVADLAYPHAGLYHHAKTPALRVVPIRWMRGLFYVHAWYAEGVLMPSDR